MLYFSVLLYYVIIMYYIKTDSCDSIGHRKQCKTTTAYSLLCVFGNNGFPKCLGGKESACQYRTSRKCRFGLWVGKIPWRGKRQPNPVFMHEKSPRDRGAWQVTAHGVERTGHDQAHTQFINSFLYNLKKIMVLNKIVPLTLVYLTK